MKRRSKFCDFCGLVLDKGRCDYCRSALGDDDTPQKAATIDMRKQWLVSVIVKTMQDHHALLKKLEEP